MRDTHVHILNCDAQFLIQVAGATVAATVLLTRRNLFHSRVFKFHLIICPACKCHVDQVETVTEALKELPAEEPESATCDFTDKLMKKISGS